MKKLALLAVVGCSALAATAQSVHRDRTAVPEYKTHRTPFAHPIPAGWQATNGAEGTTATPFWQETFGSGTNTTLPTNWTATGNAQQSATWKWRKTAVTSQYNIGVINSTTASDGWMVYDSDSIGAATTTTSTIEGYLTSPTISCVGHSTVQLSFQQHFERYNDTCYVDVSNNNGGTWTRYTVLPNNTLGGNTFLPSNPYTSLINITPTAANQANVKIRFYYICTHPDGGYNWLVDDVALAELDPVELAVDKGTFVMSLANPTTGFTSFGTYPLQLVDTIYPVGYTSNFGGSAQTNVNFTARIFRGATQVYNKSMVYTVPYNAIDSQLDFSDQAGFLPTATGTHALVFAVNQTGDALASNNTDTTLFGLSDSTLSMNTGNRASTWYVQRPASVAPGVVGYEHFGIWFEIPAGKSDTVTSVTVALANGTTAGSKVQVQIYKQQGSGASATYAFRGETIVQAFATGQISPSGGLTLVNLPMDLASSANGISDLILDEGFYAAVMRGVDNPAANTILVPSFQAPANMLGYEFGTSDTSDNTQFSYTYGNQGPFYLANSTPVVRPNFGRMAAPQTNVANVAIATLGAAYPNPANTKVTIPVSLSQASEVSVTLSTATGQIIGRQALGKQAAGRGFEISFPTGNLANGVYFYTVEAAGEKKSGRVAVAH